MKIPYTHIKHIIIASLFLCLTIFINSCTLLFPTPVTITDWSPKSSIITDIQNIQISVEFSQDMKRNITETAFSFTENSTNVYGNFTWKNDKTLIFIPYKALDGHSKYTISVDIQAEDTYGNSLQNKFVHSFSSNNDTTQIEIDSINPAHNSTITNKYQDIVISFSEPINKSTFYSAFSVTPTINGFVKFDSPQVVTFTPSEPYKYNQNYIIKISTELTDLYNNALATTQFFAFALEYDTTALTLESLQNYIPDSNTPLITLNKANISDFNPINSSWETTWGLTFTFNKKVNMDTFSTALTISPSASYTILNQYLATQQTVTLSFNSRLAYDSRYYIIIDNTLTDEFDQPFNAPIQYIIHTNGTSTKPPSISKITFLTTPISATTATWSEPSHLELIDLKEFTTEASTVFDIYFSLATGASIYSKDILTYFSVSSLSTVASITVLASDIITKTSDPQNISGPEPEDFATLDDNIAIARVYVSIIEKSGSGLISLSIGSSFQDSLKNVIEKEWSMKLIK